MLFEISHSHAGYLAAGKLAIIAKKLLRSRREGNERKGRKSLDSVHQKTFSFETGE